MCNIFDAIPKSIQDELYPHLSAILDAPDLDTARVLLNRTLEAYENKASKAMKVLEEGFSRV